MVSKACSRCKKIKNNFYPDKRRPGGLTSECVECHSDSTKKNYQKIKNSQKASQLKRWYGISLEDKDVIFKKQGGCCAICGMTLSEYFEKQKNNKKINDFAVDHNHGSGQIRGLLCVNCNHLLGKAKDNTKILLKAIEYLDYYNSLPLEKSNIIPFKKNK